MSNNILGLVAGIMSPIEIIPFVRILLMFYTLVNNMFDINHVLCRAISILYCINIYIKKGGLFTVGNVLLYR